MSVQQQIIKDIPPIYRMEYAEYLHWWLVNGMAAAATGIDAGPAIPECLQCGDKPAWDHEGYCINCSPLQVDP